MTEARYNLLRWIKGGIDETLAVARDALEAHLDGRTDDDPMSLCVDRLHQVCGTLRMVQIAGAEMLAEEMEAVAQAIAEGKVAKAKQGDAAETLMLGLVKLPDYLEQIQAGAADVPVALLPLINDLRAVRDASLLSESSLFGAELDAWLHEPVEGALPNPALGGLARRLRQRYHLGLLKVFRGPDPEEGLSQLEQVVAELSRSAGTPMVQRLYQAAHGLMSACEVRAIEAGSAVKQILSRLDRETKRIIDRGEAAVASDPPSELFRTLLFYVAKAETDDPRVAAVKDQFALGKLWSAASAAASGELSGLNEELLNSVRGALSDDLTLIKDGLDLFMRGGGRDLDRVAVLVAPIGKVADTLGMVGQGGLRARLKKLAERVDAIASGAEEQTDAGLMDMAGEILFVESSLVDLGSGEVAAETAPGISIPEGEYRSLVRSTLHEASTELVKAEEAITSFLERPGDHELVEDVPGRFRSVAGALQIIGVSEPAGMMASLGGYFDEKVLRASGVLDTNAQDALADIVTSVEFYMDALSHGERGRESLMDIARSGLDRLGLERLPAEPVEAVLSEEAPEAVATDSAGLSLVEAEEQPVTESEEEPPEELGATVAVGEAAFVEAEAGEEAEIGAVEVVGEEAGETIHEIEEAAGEVLTEALSPSGEEVGSVDVSEGADEADAPQAAETYEPDVDTEILEIFLEEAREELDTIRELVPRWRNDDSDTEALTTFRRSFHTLKGSGRLVGAFTIGEYAWSVENMLNRLIEGTTSLSPEVGAVLDASLDVLPRLIHSQESGEPHGVDVEGLMAQAFELAGGKPAGLSAPPRVAEPVPRVQPVPQEEPPLEEYGTHSLDEEPPETGPVDEEGVPEEGPALALDPVLAEIFEAESRAHLGTLGRYVEDARASLYEPEIAESVCRAFHTLHGSAHMAEVEPVAAVSASMERYANQLRAMEQPASAGVVDLIARSTEAVDDLLGAINQVDAPLPDWKGLISDIEKARDLLEHPGREVDADLGEGGIPAAETREITSGEAGPLEAEQAEAEWLEPEQPEAELAQAERLEAGEPEAEPTQAEWLEAEQPEAEPAASERVEAERVEAERAEAERVEAERVEAERVEAERVEAERVEAERVEAERVEAERVEAERAEAERVEAERVEAERIEAERIEAERVEAERVEAERLEAERAEAEEAAEYFGDSILVEADEDLVEIFLEEARELVESMDGAMQQWVADPRGKAPIAGLQRTLHTLKGGARLAGIMPVGDLSHSFESLLTALDHERIAIDQGVVQLAQRVADRLVGQIEEVARAGRVHKADDLLSELDVAITGRPQSAAEEAELPAGPEVEREEVEPSAEVLEFPARRPVVVERPGGPEALVEAAEARAPGGRARRTGQEQVRVRADLLDRLVDNAGEVSIYRARLEEQSGALGFNLAELDQTVNRLRQQLRQLEMETEAQILFRYERDKEQGAQYDEDFDPLEMDRFSTIQQLSRSLGETVNDLVSIRDIMDDANREGETLLLQQSRVTTDLQDGLLRTRMVPFSTLVPRLQRVVRQTCVQVGSKAVLDVHGAEEEMDRSILERMIAPIEHILRNAVSHGIEQPPERVEQAKDETGRISLYLTREGNDAVLTVSDDGRGLRLDAIRAKAIERGLLTANSKVSDDDLMQLILEHGFSTSDVVTQISGRGVGMDVVISEVKQLGGAVEIDSQAGRGSSFTVRLPLTLAITHALLVQLNEQVFAIPHTSVHGVVRASREDVEACYAQRRAGIEYAGHTYSVRYLGAILETGSLMLSEQIRWVPLLLVRAGEHRVALQVDGLLGNRQIVVKSVGPQLSSVRWITGGTILGDGRVALILDVNALVRMGAMQAVELPPEPEEEESAAGVTVMVVDDSITVRKVTSRLLERHNMTVLTAKDGVDGVAKLQEQVPDVMLLDIEMPRMDGYELARHMRNSPDLADVPIIMITSRTGEKHRARAFELGVDRYLGKPYQESDLLDNIYSLLAEKRS